MSYRREMATMLIAQKGACGMVPCIPEKATGNDTESTCPCCTEDGCAAAIIAHDKPLSPCAAAVQVARQWLIDNPEKEEK